jgi:hypothetical protein
MSNVERETVDQVLAHDHKASKILRSWGIDATSRMSLDSAAAAASVTPDELLAVLEMRMRREARRRAHESFEIGSLS